MDSSILRTDYWNWQSHLLFQCLHYIQQVQALNKAHSAVVNSNNINKTTYLEEKPCIYFVILH